MGPSDFKIVTGEERADLLEAADEVTTPSWPEFMRKDPIAGEHWRGLYEHFPGFQFAMIDTTVDRLIAVGNSLPLSWVGRPDELPDDGWDWAMTSGFADVAAGRPPKTMSALQVAVAAEYRGRGISRQMINHMRRIGQAHRLRALVAPVRPSGKCRYPLTPMDEYIKWTNDDGLPFDPWMRVHARLGAATIRTCPSSMRISGTVAEWEDWTGMAFPQTGRYILPEALVPITIDREADRGTYIEPNVWMYHKLT